MNVLVDNWDGPELVEINFAPETIVDGEYQQIVDEMENPTFPDQRVDQIIDQHHEFCFKDYLQDMIRFTDIPR